MQRRRERGRGERVLPGVYRLRVPLPWPGVPHGNAWAIRRDGGFVLFDCGLPGEDNVAELERALAMCDLELEQARLVVCTHAHLDHCGAAPYIAELTGCESTCTPATRTCCACSASPRSSTRRASTARAVRACRRS